MLFTDEENNGPLYRVQSDTSKLSPYRPEIGYLSEHTIAPDGTWLVSRSGSGSIVATSLVDERVNGAPWFLARQRMAVRGPE